MVCCVLWACPTDGFHTNQHDHGQSNPQEPILEGHASHGPSGAFTLRLFKRPGSSPHCGSGRRSFVVHDGGMPYGDSFEWGRRQRSGQVSRRLRRIHRAFPQTLTIVITDSQARAYGFQMTARLESDLAKGQAGDFTAGAQQFVLCDDNSNVRTPTRACPANALVQFIEHSDPFRTNTITVQWSAACYECTGNIHIYVAAFAANADGNNTSDHIYTASYVLTPQSTAAAPTIASVVSASAFSQTAGLASGTWLEIYGTGLSATTRSWAGSDFNGLLAPVSLDDVKVTVNGIPGFVDFISPGQVNIQAPEDATTGKSVEVQLINGGLKSNVVAIPKAATAPALLAPLHF